MTGLGNYMTVVAFILKDIKYLLFHFPGAVTFRTIFKIGHIWIVGFG
jgi:hypothetical protein